MTDTDSRMLAADADVTTVQAAYLNAAMARNPAARAAYASLWRVEWTSLGSGVEINDGATARAVTAY